MIAALSSVAGVSSSLAGAAETAVAGAQHAGGVAGPAGAPAGASGTHGLSLSSEPAAEAAGGLESASGVESASGLQGAASIEGAGGVRGTGGEGAAGVESTSGAEGGAGGGFGEALTSAISSLEQTQQQASGAAQALATGTVSDPEAAVVTVDEAQLAMQLASQIRSKATEAVQQIFQTQV